MTVSVADFDSFLEDKGREIDWSKPVGAPAAISTVRVHTGNGIDGLEIAVATSLAAPKMDDVRKLWKLRWGRRATPVLLVVAYPIPHVGWGATVCGTNDDPAAMPGLNLAQVERICAAALAEPNAPAAKRTLHRLLTGPKDQLIAGLTNQGLFASHELRNGVPKRADWATATTAGAMVLGKTGNALIAGLGYTVTPHGSNAQILSAAEALHAVAILLDETEVFDRPSSRFGATSPVQQGLALAQEQRLPWLIVTRGTQIRLYPAKPDVGVGRKGQAETFLELDLALLTAEDAAYLPLLFSPAALSDTGSVKEILAASADHAAALGKRLRDRVYVDVVPKLAVAIANQMKAGQVADMSDDDLHEAYHRTLIILFRLLFVSYAEDRGLLPYGRNPRYTRKALKTFARDYTEAPDTDFDDNATDLWEDLHAVWKAVDDGNADWDVPAYNGGLFAADAAHPSGAALRAMTLNNAEIGPALRSLLIDTGDDGTVGPVDFRALSVREFGTVYEGLLESSLSIAPTDLTVDPRTNAYLPARSTDEIEVQAGDVYFHNASGARKSTGSYFTKTFAVEHLLDAALEPALTMHLATVKALRDAGDDAGAAEKFFDFRVADLAMGSGHFLVAAIDRIEARFSKFLAESPISSINDELDRLAVAAQRNLGENADAVEVEPSMLLRRQIARRCVYGLDLNLMAVELARLGIWIHTFVPGLPMSSLDHGLVVGNSLTGVGSVDEALDIFEPGIATTGQYSLFGDQIEEALGVARDRLLRVARTDEATKREVTEAAVAHAKAMADASEARALLDCAIAVRLGVIANPTDPSTAIEQGLSEIVRVKIAELKCAHFPFLFPEVFVRDNPGFDVVVGNPPWDEVMVEEPKFWQRHAPGVMGLKPAALKNRIKELRAERPDLLAELEIEQALMADQRTVLMAGPYPGLSRGDIDYYKAFSWRDWHALRSGGRMGVVFPRSLLSAAGSAKWRTDTLAKGRIASAITLVNTGKWVFDEVDGRYSVVLLTVEKNQPDPDSAVVGIAGPFHSLAEFDQAAGILGSMPARSLVDWGNGAAFPLLPTTESAEIFAKYRRHPRFDDPTVGWDFRSVREFDATNDRDTFDDGPESPGRWPVYTGATFNLWDPDAGDPYTWANKGKVVEALFTKRKRQARTSSSAFYGLPGRIVNDKATLPCMGSRVAIRDVARATDTRTVLAALVPSQIVLTNAAPYLFPVKGDARDEAFVLGTLCSIPLDWYARRFVELHVNQHVLSAFPIPNPDATSPLRARVVEIAGRLAAVDDRYTDWAAEVGVLVGSVTDEATKDDLIAELDACVALLYGLDRSDVEHVFATFHRGWNFQPRLDAVLTHFEAWQAKEDM